VKHDEITGKWYANAKTEGLRLEFVDKPVKVWYDYSPVPDIDDKWAKATLINRLGGWWNTPKDLGFTIGRYKARPNVIFDLPIKASGTFVINEKTGDFRLFYQKEKFGFGQLDQPEQFFVDM